MKVSRRKFGTADDSELVDYVLTYGDNNWAYIAEHMSGGFTARQCRERWRHYLDPDVTATEWTSAEDAQLLAKVEEFGAHWTTIAHQFPGRSGNTVRNRYQLLMRKMQKKDPRRDEPPDRCWIERAPRIGSKDDAVRPDRFTDLTVGDVMMWLFPST
jgi:hypothetical protein